MAHSQRLRMRHPIVIAGVLVVLGLGLRAQTEPAPDPSPIQDLEPSRGLFASGVWRKQAAVKGEPKATLWMVYRGARDLRLLDQQAHLQQLQLRHADRGVRIVVVLPKDEIGRAHV